MTKSLAECMTLTQNQYVCFHLCRPCICNRQPGCASWMLSDYTYASLFTLCGENSVWCCQRNSLRLLQHVDCETVQEHETGSVQVEFEQHSLIHKREHD